GRIRTVHGMGPKKEALILKALDDQKRFAGRRLLPEAHDAAAAMVAYLRERAPEATIEPVGSLRRGCDTCGDLDLLASGAAASPRIPKRRSTRRSDSTGFRRSCARCAAKSTPPRRTRCRA